MFNQSVYKRAIAICLATISGVVFSPSISTQVPSAVAQSTPPKLSQVKNPTDFNLKGNSEPFFPASLKQSDVPGGGTRAIIGGDNRTPMTSSAFPWSAVGRIAGIADDGSEYSCTATLIAEDMVLTNAHCVVNPDTGQLSKTIAFQPNLINGRLRKQDDLAYATQVYYGTDFRDGSFVDDWAILKLNQPLGRKYGYLGLKSLPSTTLIRNKLKYALVGYSGDFPDPAKYREFTAGPSFTAGVHRRCSFVMEQQQLLFHECDTKGGASGGAIIGRVAGQYYILALHSGWNEVNGRVLNRAVMVSRIQAALQGQ